MGNGANPPPEKVPSGHEAMGGTAHGALSRRADAVPVNRLTTSCPTAVVEADDAGRTILEAVVALALIAMAVIGWGRLSVTSARTEASVAHRETALELAHNALEELRVRPWDAAAIDPASAGVVRRFEGNRTVTDPNGIAAESIVTTDGPDFTITTHITESPAESWRRVTVVVVWTDEQRSASLRLDSALRRADQGSLP